MNPYLLALVSLPKMTPTRLRLLLRHRTPEQAWHATSTSLLSSLQDQDYVTEITKARPHLDPDTLTSNLNKLGGTLLHESDTQFPQALKTIGAPPAWLFVRGSLKYLTHPCLTVVGPRKISAYGRQVTEEIVQALAHSGLTIVSGLALGVDATAHRAALDVEGFTVGVLGCGIDELYPPRNRQLGLEIIQRGGAIISEYPPGTEPARQNFPTRNRLVAGLSSAVLVTEASEKSGSLITATLALEQNKTVFAIPGSIYSATSAGTNALIKSGQAQAVTSATDILEALQFEDVISFREKKRVFPQNPTERQIYEHLSGIPIHIDELAHLTSLPTSTLATTISMLEIKGFIQDIGGQNYVQK